MKLSVLLGLSASVTAAPAADLVSSLPDFASMGSSKLYSGYLTVPGPINGYDSLQIHYMFHESQGSPANDPIVAWHQGGPGGNSLYGLFGEVGYYQVDDDGAHTNAYSWNQKANLLYLDSPAGSNNPIGFSQCIKGGKPAAVCTWDDKTQAEAYAHTLAAFLAAFPEQKGSDLILAGESYAGQYLPNIATFILGSEFKDTLNLKGIMVGNGCWGGTKNAVVCNGENSEQNDIDMFYGKGLISKPLYDDVYTACSFPTIASPKCLSALEHATAAVGPHNVYNIYDNCPQTAALLARTGKSMYWLKSMLRSRLDHPVNQTSVSVADANRNLAEFLGVSDLLDSEAGFDWGCNGIGAMGDYMGRKEVQAALHIEHAFAGLFNYAQSGPASVTLYPELVKQIRVLIFNGDADACVPYKGNEEWTENMAAAGHVSQSEAWHPWFVKTDVSKGSVPVGYATNYKVPGTSLDFAFVTIRLAGHMVPAFQPSPALEMLTRFLDGRSF